MFQKIKDAYFNTFYYIQVHVYYIILITFYHNRHPDTKIFNHLDETVIFFCHYKYTPTLIYYHQFKELP